MYTKPFENITHEEIGEFLTLLNSKLNNFEQLHTLSSNSNNGLSMHDAKSSMVKLLYNEFWLDRVLTEYLNSHFKDDEKMESIEFFKTNVSKNKSNFSVEHIKNGQITVFLSDSTSMHAFKHQNLDTLKLCLIATNHHLDTVVHEDKLFNAVFSIASAGCNKDNDQITAETGYEWLNELPDVYDIAQWLTNYLTDNNMRYAHKYITSLLEYTAKSKVSPISNNVKSQVTPDNKLNRVEDQSMTTNALISTAYKLNLAEMLMV